MELLHEARAVTGDGVPAHGHDRGDVGPLGCHRDGEHRRPGGGEQPLERHVQVRERRGRPVGVDLGSRLGAGPRGHAPGAGQRLGQVVLLGEDVGGAVAEATRFEHHHLRVGVEQVEHHGAVGVVGVDQPRQPRLHAVEHLALGQPLPLLATPRLARHQRLGTGADVGGRDQLTAREHDQLGDLVGGALVVDAELRQAVDLVAPQVDAHRGVGRGREHVDDRAAHRHLAPVLDLLLPAVPGVHQPGHQLVAVALLALGDDERLHVGGTRAEPLGQRPDRCHHHCRHPAGRAVGGATEAPQRAEAAAHGLDAGADALERQRLPRGEELDRVGAEEGGEVVRQPLGVGRRGHRHHHRAALRAVHQPRQHQGPGRVGHGQDRVRAPRDRHEAGFFAQQWGEVGEGHGSDLVEGSGARRRGRTSRPA